VGAVFVAGVGGAVGDVADIGVAGSLISCSRYVSRETFREDFLSLALSFEAVDALECRDSGVATRFP
jgi:hypothetical protein